MPSLFPSWKNVVTPKALLMLSWEDIYARAKQIFQNRLHRDPTNEEINQLWSTIYHKGMYVEFEDFCRIVDRHCWEQCDKVDEANRVRVIETQITCIQEECQLSNKDEKLFADAFHEAVNERIDKVFKSLEHDMNTWQRTKGVTGKIYQKIRQTEFIERFVNVYVEDSDHRNNGFLQVYGWEVVPEENQ